MSDEPDFNMDGYKLNKLAAGGVAEFRSYYGCDVGTFNAEYFDRCVTTYDFIFKDFSTYSVLGSNKDFDDDRCRLAVAAPKTYIIKNLIKYESDKKKNTVKCLSDWVKLYGNPSGIIFNNLLDELNFTIKKIKALEKLLHDCESNYKKRARVKE